MSIESRIGDWIFRSVTFAASRVLRAQKEYHRGDVTIPYWRIDRGRPRWLVNIPGFSDEKESFFPTALQLRDDFNFLLPETPGFGESTRDASLEYRVENYAQWVIEFLRQCAPEKVWLVGNSLGGAIASRVALEAPELLHGCIPVGSAGYFHSSDCRAFCKASEKVPPKLMTSPTLFIWVPSNRLAPLNFSKFQRGILTTT